jgi:exopolysaccharide production protein ExoZ
VSFAALYAIPMRRRLVELGCIFVGLSACIQYFHPNALWAVPLTFWGNWVTCEFLAGCLIGTAYIEGWFEGIPLWVSFAALAAAIAALVAFAITHPGTDDREIWKGMPAFVIVAAILAMERARPFRSRSLYRIGDATYSIYLSHLFVVMGLRKLWLSAHLPTTGYLLLFYVTACLVGAIALGLFVYESRFGEKWLNAKAKFVLQRLTYAASKT